MFHTIGDSHASNIHSAWKIFENKIKSHHIGPCLAYSFGRDKLKRINLQKLGIQENDIVCFCLGEIDVRCHIHKYINTNTYKNIINNIIEMYIEAINENIKTYKNIKVCIYNIIPPKYYIEGMEYNPDFPFLGTNEDRLQYTKYFNSKLKECCNTYNFIFIDIYNNYCDNNGFLDLHKSDNSVHIIDGNYLKHYLENILKLI